MNVFAVYAVNEHINDLMAEADQERLAKVFRANETRTAKAGGFVASFLAALRSSIFPGTPKLDAWPYRS